MAEKRYTLRIDENLLKKLHVLAANEGRSANKQVIFLIKEFLKEFEKNYENIPE